MTFADWSRIFEHARENVQTVTVHLASGTVFTGIVTAVDEKLASLDQRDPETAQVTEHLVAQAAIVAVTLHPEDP